MTAVGNVNAPTRAGFLAVCVVALACASAHPRAGSVASVRITARGEAMVVDEIVSLGTRGDVTQSYLLSTERGASRGTVSAAYVGAALGRRLAGVVLTSTVFLGNRNAAGLWGFDYARIPVPLLFVHDTEDACPCCPYDEAAKLGKVYPLITVKGSRPPRSGPCEPLAAHGFFGKEPHTVAAIKAWMLGRSDAAAVE